MIVADGDKPPAVWMFLDYPQSDPQVVNAVGIILSDGFFCLDFEFCD